MVTLVLMRHSKAVPAGRGADHERPLLLPRGPKDAALAGAALARGGAPDLALVSDARRTRETFEAVAACFGSPVPHRTEPRLYGAAPAAILTLLRQAGDDVRRLLVIGHNPGLGDLARRLAGSGDAAALATLAVRFPTSAFAVLNFPAGHWADLGPGGTLETFFTIGEGGD